MSSEGRNCLVTGGTKGIGKATVEEFAKEKARVPHALAIEKENGVAVFTCSRQQNELESRLQEWKEKGYDVQGCVCDVSDTDALKNLANKASTFNDNPKGLTAFDCLVNNAGGNIKKRTLEYSDEDYYSLMNTHVKAGYDLSRLCYPLLKAPTASSIIFIGSVSGGQRVNKAGPIYAFAKAAQEQLTKCLACEWAIDGIRVNCIAPGCIVTPLIEDVLAKPGVMDKVVSETPMKRAGVVAFFCSNRASFITGQTIYVDGGYSIRGLGY